MSAHFAKGAKRMAKPGFYHTGMDSFENPEIRFFEHVPHDQSFGFGPFKTFKEARKDFIEMIKYDIENLKHLLSNVKSIDEFSDFLAREKIKESKAKKKTKTKKS